MPQNDLMKLLVPRYAALLDRLLCILAAGLSQFIDNFRDPTEDTEESKPAVKPETRVSRKAAAGCLSYFASCSLDMN